MITNESKVIKKLTQEELLVLTEELNTNHGLWVKHPMSYNALSDGSTIVINWVTKINRFYQLHWTMREKFPKTWELLNTLAQGREFGKVYWHRLDPGICAKPHTDAKNSYIKENICYKRYNIYLEVDKDIIFRFDDSNTPIPDPKILTNSIFDLAATRIHSVNNISNTTLYVMVVDILEKGVQVYDDLFCVNEINPKGKYRLC